MCNKVSKRISQNSFLLKSNAGYIFYCQLLGIYVYTEKPKMNFGIEHKLAHLAYPCPIYTWNAQYHHSFISLMRWHSSKELRRQIPDTCRYLFRHISKTTKLDNVSLVIFSTGNRKCLPGKPVKKQQHIFVLDFTCNNFFNSFFILSLVQQNLFL